MTTSPLAVDAKGHVTAIGDDIGGVRQVDFEIRHGDTVKLHVTDGTIAARLRSALLAGDCIEVLYEESNATTDGLLFHIC